MAYRVSQGAAVLIIGLSFLDSPMPPDTPVLLPLALTLAAIFLLAFIVRIFGGNNAGAISLVLISLYPGFSYSFDRALALFCLSALVALLATRNSAGHPRDNVTLGLALVVPIALGWHMRLCFLPLSAAIGFAYLLLRYVPPDATRPYRMLLNSLRTNRSSATWELLVITIAGLLSLLPFMLPSATRLHSAVNSAMGDPVGYLLAVAGLFFQFLGTGESIDTLPVLLIPLLFIASSVTLWWLFVSVQSGSGLSFSLTAIPVVYLLCGALGLTAGCSYAHPVYAILMANLIMFLGIWLRGRANKRVLDSTPD